MVTVHLLQPDGTLQHGGTELIERDGLVWVDVLAPGEQELRELAVLFDLHPLVVDDCLSLGQRPKLEEYPDYLFIVLHSFAQRGEDLTELDMQEVHFILGPDWVMTIHASACGAVEEALRRIRTAPKDTLTKGVDRVVYLVSDSLVDRLFPVLDAFNDELEELETRVFANAQSAQLERIFELKRVLGQLRRVMSPQRDVVGLLARRGLPYVQDRTTLYFRDVYDHLVRLYEHLEAGRDFLGSVMDVYLSMMANRTADISRQLTVVATLFLPLSFIVGFFGQNFSELSGPVWFRVMLGSLVLVPVVLFLVFRGRRWL